jgi:hypothetical protein
MTKRLPSTRPDRISFALAFAFALVAAATAMAASACGNGDDNSSPVPTLDATTGDVTPAPAGIRVANWVPDLSSAAIDVCLSPRGLGLFQGPVLAGGNLVFVPDGGPPDDATLTAFFPNEDDAGASGVAFGQLSVYASIPQGPYDVRFVVANAPDCSQPIAPDLLNAGAFASATLTTVAIYGSQTATDPTIAVSSMAMVDDATLAGTSKIDLRFINALPQLPWPDGTVVDAPVVDFGTGQATDGSTASSFKALYVGVPYGGISDKSQTQIATQSATASVDSHGYGSIAPLSLSGLSAHRSGSLFDIAETGDMLMGLSIGGGTIVTAALLPPGCTDSDPEAGCGLPAQIAVYLDNAPALGSPFTPCVTCADGGSP